MSDLTDVDVDQDSLETLQDDVDQVQSDLESVESEAKSEYASEIDAVRLAVTAVNTTLESAVAEPTPDTVLAVGTAVQALGTALTSLDNSVESTC